MANVSTTSRVRVDPLADEIIGYRAERLDDIDDAFRNEREVFVAAGYGEMPQEYDIQSTFYLARSAVTGEVLGSIRMIDGGPLAPPMMKLPIADEWARRLAGVPVDRLSEYGALPIPTHIQADVGLAVSKALYRVGWSHAAERDALYSGMVMEPRRAKAMGRWHGLVMEQGGPTEYYMGGDVAAFFATPRSIINSVFAVNQELGEYMSADFDLGTQPMTRVIPVPTSMP